MLGDADRFCGACGRERAVRFRPATAAASVVSSSSERVVGPGDWFEPTAVAPVVVPLEVESFHRRWRAIRLAVLVVIACHVLLLLVLMYDINVILLASDGNERAAAEVDGSLAAVRVMCGVTVVAWIVASVLTLRWVDFTWGQLKRSAAPLPRWDASWSAWSWIVPVVNLWMPVRVMSALLRAGHVPPGGGGESAAAPPIKVPRVFGWWWGMFVVGFSVVMLGWLVWFTAVPPESGDESFRTVEQYYAAGDVVMFPGVGLLIISGLCFLSAVGHVGRSPRWRRTPVEG